MILGGLILSTTGGFVLHLIPGKALLVFSGAGWIGALLLFALAPLGANYWAFTFPRQVTNIALLLASEVLTNVAVGYLPRLASTSLST